MDTIRGLKAGSLKPDTATAIASLANAYLATVKTDIEIARVHADLKVPMPTEEREAAEIEPVTPRAVPANSTISAAIRDSALVQARELYRAHIGGGGSYNTEIESQLMNDYGLNRTQVSAIREELRTAR